MNFSSGSGEAAQVAGNDPSLFDQPTYCLLCGTVTYDPIVKQEIDTYEDQSSEKVVFPLQGTPWSGLQREMFKTFRAKFYIPKNKSRWDLDKERFPFCQECQAKLTLIADLESQVKEIRNKLTEKVIMSEPIFAANHIYEKDLRYYRVRKQMKLIKNMPKIRLTPCVPNRESRIKKEVSGSLHKYSPNSSFSNENLSAETSAPVEPTEKRSSRIIEKFKKNEDEPFQQSVLLPPFQADTDQHSVHSDGFNDDMTNDDELPQNDRLFSEVTTEPKKRRRKAATSCTNYNLNDDQFVREWLLEDDDAVSDENEASNYSDNEEVVSPGKQKKKQPGGRKIIVRSQESEEEDEDEDFVVSNDDACSSSDDEGEAEIPDLGKDEGSNNAKLIYNDANKTYSYLNIVFDADGELKYKCRECVSVLESDDKSKLEKSIKDHAIREHTNLYTCNFCDYRGVNKAGLRLHLNSHRKKLKKNTSKPKKKRPRRVKVDCEICGKTLSCQSILKRHQYSHMSEEEKNEAIARGEIAQSDLRVQCDECGLEVSTLSLLAHKKTHIPKDQRPTKQKELCPLCGVSYIQLKHHMFQVHRETVAKNAQKFICSECNAEFYKWNVLQKHKKLVHMEKTLECTMCTRKFSIERHLKNHMKGHLGIRDVLCPHCPSTFITSNAMRQHARIYHTEGSKVPKRKPYVRGPTQLKHNERKADLVKSNTYCPPSYQSWFKPKHDASSNASEEQQESSSTLKLHSSLNFN